MSDFLKPLNDLLEVTRGAVHGNQEAISRLGEMTECRDIPSLIVELAEQINYLSVQKDATEFRLELMIEDLLETQAALVNAKHDSLTGLPNRGLFHELLHRACAEARRSAQTLALMFIDLDKFKQVNDTMGHEAGDELLIQASQRLQFCIRENDILARLGGDEFTIVLCHLADPEIGIRIAERIVANMKSSFDLSMGRADIGCSIGMSFFPKDADRALSLLKNADIAMYRAKEAGRNTYRLYRPGIP